MPITIPSTADSARAMIFVDGENLAIRYGRMLTDRGQQPAASIEYERDVFVWSHSLNPTPNLTNKTPAVMRKYYYTAVRGIILPSLASRLA